MFNPVPKPKKGKRHKAKNNPMPTIDDICTHESGCQMPYAHNHEVYFGKNRQNSIDYKMQKRLCEEHHEGPEGPHHNKAYDDKLKREHQVIFEQKYSRELFIKIFGKSYL